MYLNLGAIYFNFGAMFLNFGAKIENRVFWVWGRRWVGPSGPPGGLSAYHLRLLGEICWKKKLKGHSGNKFVRKSSNNW